MGLRAWHVRFLRSFGVASSSLIAACANSTALAQEVDYRPVASAPAVWGAFAQQLQRRFEARLAADDNQARAFQDRLKERDARKDTPPLTFAARVWILPDGTIGRLDFDGLDDTEIAIHLRALLAGDNVGPPPSDMLQPLRLRLSARPKEQPAGGR